MLPSVFDQRQIDKMKLVILPSEGNLVAGRLEDGLARGNLSMVHHMNV